MNHRSPFLFALFALFTLAPFHPSTLDLSAQTTGKEFWICIPPNEVNPFPTSALEIYVSSEYDTEIEVLDAAGDRTYKRKVSAGQVRTLSDSRGETNWTWEIREFEEAVKKGIRITSKHPIAVHVLNSKVTTADGYMAYPTAAWGTDYVVAAYYDFKEGRPWAGGFCIVAKEPTTVKIKLKGTGALDAKTSGGRSIGDSITVSLDEGEVYAVCGDGTTRGLFDLTGTHIASDKPIGVFGFHQRTTMPNLLVNGNGRDHLVEMLPPTYMWGKKYATTEFIRSGPNANAKGDMFRVIASQPNTKWTAKSYDKSSKAQTMSSGGLLTNAGDFTDMQQSTGPTIMPNGYTVFEADKPILVVQYCNSANFDGDTYHDPFMICLTPIEQFIYKTIFQHPTDSKYSTHNLNLIVWADTSDPKYVDNLKSLEIDSEPVWNHPLSATPTLLFNHMGNNLHWVSLKFGPSAESHRITSNGKVTMSGYVYGYGAVDSYGWSVASATIDRNTLDTLPPVVTGTMNCGTLSAEATELRNNPNPPRTPARDTDQVDKGIAEIDTVAGEGSYNYRIVLVTDTELPRVPSYKRFRFNCEVIDRSKPAYCVYFVRDWANNVTIDTLRYDPPSLTLAPDVVRFGERPLNSPDTISVTITNSGVTPLIITSTTLEIGQRYTLLDAVAAPGITLSPGQLHTLKVVYSADEETQNVETDLDTDTIIVALACGNWHVPVSGVASQALIEIEDYNAGYIDPGVTTCKSGGLKITNNGSDTLVITGFTGLAGTNFSVSPAGLTALPYTIYPKATYQMKDVCYQRIDAGTDSIVVTFSSNAAGPKPTSIWKARTTITSVTEFTEDEVSISMSTNTVTVSWKGAGVSRITVTDVSGRSIAEASVNEQLHRASLEINSVAHQALIIVLYDREGTPLYIGKEIAP